MAPDTHRRRKVPERQFRDIVTDVCGARRPRDHHAEIADQVLTIFNRRTVALTDLTWVVNIELIKRTR